MRIIYEGELWQYFLWVSLWIESFYPWYLWSFVTFCFQCHQPSFGSLISLLENYINIQTVLSASFLAKPVFMFLSVYSSWNGLLLMSPSYLLNQVKYRLMTLGFKTFCSVMISTHMLLTLLSLLFHMYNIALVLDNSCASHIFCLWCEYFWYPPIHILKS